MKKRNITSFEAENDVAALLVRVSATGITIREVANRALRTYGVRVVQEIIKEKRRKLTFNPPGRSSAGQSHFAFTE